MSLCMDLLESSEQLCYVQCSFCTTILLVSVPCSSLLRMVTVRCGHCAGLLSVNMMRASLLPLHLLAPFNDGKMKTMQEMQVPCGDHASLKACEENCPLSSSLDDHQDKLPPTHVNVVNKPPEKRQRAPSAYNRFIKEEIQRLKAIEPGITHKEAFSTAAKNWAHFPRIQLKERGESCSHGGKLGRDAHVNDEVDVQRKGFRQRKASRHSTWTRAASE